MKFTDGQWPMRLGVIAHHAAEAGSIASLGDKLLS
jgi:hypothetical protein